MGSGRAEPQEPTGSIARCPSMSLHMIGSILIWLVVWNIWIIVPYIYIYIWNFIIPTAELHHFSEGLKPPPTS